MTFIVITGVLVTLAIAFHFMMKPSKIREQISSWICGLLTVFCIIAGLANLINWRVCVAWLIAAVISSLYLFYCIGEANKYPELEEIDYDDDYEDEDPEAEFFETLDKFPEQCEKKKATRASF